MVPIETRRLEESQVPQLKFNDLESGGVSVNDNFYTSPKVSARLDRLLYNTASAGQPPQLYSKHQNESYELQFYGPALSCSSASETLISAANTAYGGSVLGGYHSFISCVGGEENVLTDSALLNQSLNTIDVTSNDAARIYVMTNADGVHVTECQLYNASYNVQFDFHYPHQAISTSITKYEDPIAISSLTDVILEVLFIYIINSGHAFLCYHYAIFW